MGREGTRRPVLAERWLVELATHPAGRRHRHPDNWGTSVSMGCLPAGMWASWGHGDISTMGHVFHGWASSHTSPAPRDGPGRHLVPCVIINGSQAFFRVWTVTYSYFPRGTPPPSSPPLPHGPHSPLTSALWPRGASVSRTSHLWASAAGLLSTGHPVPLDHSWPALSPQPALNLPTEA